MKLPKGITGFSKIAEIKSLNTVEILRKISFPFLKIGNYEKPNPSSNYFRQKIKNTITNQTFDILINDNYYWVSSIDSESNWMNLNFIETPIELSIQLKNSEFDIQILSIDFLNREFTLEEIDDLEPFEIDQIKYWKTNKIGDIIFNGYD